MPVTSHSDIAAALENALAQRAGLSGKVENLHRLTGGATKQTWSFDLLLAEQRLALILQQLPGLPPADVGGGRRVPKLTAREEAQLMMAAGRHSVPAPVVRLILEPGDALGEGYVTERVAGDTLGRTIVRDAVYAQARDMMAAQCGRILAAIHTMPISEAPFLLSLDPAEELDVYEGLLRRHAVQHPALEYALRWVREHLPTDAPRAIVHADFRTGNLIVGDDGIRCVLDWEIARIGDPLQDFGVLCMRTWRFGGTPPVGGFGTREDFYTAYEAAGGGPVDRERARFWEAFANLKWAINCVRRGLATKPDGRAASLELAAVGRRLEEPLWDFFELTANGAST